MKNLSRTLKPIYTLEQLNSAIGSVNGRLPKTAMQIGKIGRFVKIQDGSYATAGPLKLLVRKMKFLIRNGEFATHAGELNAAKSLVEKLEALNKQGKVLLKKAGFFKRIAIWINQAFDRIGFRHQKELERLIKKYPVLKQPLVVQNTAVVTNAAGNRSPSVKITAPPKNNSVKDPSKNNHKTVLPKLNPGIAPLPTSKPLGSSTNHSKASLSTANNEIVFTQASLSHTANWVNGADIAIATAYLAKDQEATRDGLATLITEEPFKLNGEPLTDKNALFRRNELANCSNLPMCLNENGPLYFGEKVEISNDGTVLLMDRSNDSYVNLFILLSEKGIQKALIEGNQQIVSFRIYNGFYEFFDLQGAPDMMGQGDPYVKRCKTAEDAIFYLQQRFPVISEIDEPAFNTLSVTPLRAFKESFKELFAIPSYVQDPEEFTPVSLEGTIPYFNNHYKGAQQNGVPHGEGREYNADGMLVYKGCYENGQRHGKGTMIMRTLDSSKIECNRYVGEFNANKITGTGTYYWTNGNIYHGGMKDSKKEGFGVTVNQNGVIFVGRCKEGVRHGAARLFENGEWKKMEYAQGKHVELLK